MKNFMKYTIHNLMKSLCEFARSLDYSTLSTLRNNGLSKSIYFFKGERGLAASGNMFVLRLS